MLNEELQASQEKWNLRFGRFIREGRKEKGITQVMLCRNIGIAQSYYSSIENGKANVDLGLAMTICGYLDLNMNDLVRKYKNET